MKKRKGFTLAELLAVIVILGIITSITVPIVTNQIDKYKTKVCVTQYDNILNAARSYVADNLLALSDSDIVTLSELGNKGYIDASSLKDPVTKETISSELQIHIVKMGKKYKYYLDDSVNTGCKDDLKQKFYSERSLSVGTAVLYNPVTGKKCVDYTEANSTIGKNSGCMKWYVIKDNSGDSTVDVILDHNTTANIAYNSTGKNSEMKEAKKELDDATGTWNNANTARLIMAEEVKKITGNTKWDPAKEDTWFCFDPNQEDLTTNSCAMKAQGKSNYAWLFDYTYECTSFGCNRSDFTYGYWTSSPYRGNSGYMWLVDSNGKVVTQPVTNDADYGVRPVITVSKADI